MTKTATRMLRLMDRAVTHWRIPVIGREKGRVRGAAAQASARGGIEAAPFGYYRHPVAGYLPGAGA